MTQAHSIRRTKSFFALSYVVRCSLKLSLPPQDWLDFGKGINQGFTLGLAIMEGGGYSYEKPRSYYMDGKEMLYAPGRALHAVLWADQIWGLLDFR